MGYKITIRVRARRFATLEAAREWANDYHRRTGVIVGIEASEPAVFACHRKRIAAQTARMPDAIRGVM